MNSVTNNMNEENELRIEMAMHMQLLLKCSANTLNGQLIKESYDFTELQLIVNTIVGNVNQLEIFDTDIGYKAALVDEVICLQEEYLAQMDMVLMYGENCKDKYKEVAALLNEFSKLGIYNAFIGLEVECLGELSEEELSQKIEEMENDPNLNSHTWGLYSEPTGENYVINDMSEYERDNRFAEFIENYWD